MCQIRIENVTVGKIKIEIRKITKPREANVSQQDAGDQVEHEPVSSSYKGHNVSSSESL